MLHKTQSFKGNLDRRFRNTEVIRMHSGPAERTWSNFSKSRAEQVQSQKKTKEKTHTTRKTKSSQDQSKTNAHSLHVTPSAHEKTGLNKIQTQT